METEKDFEEQNENTTAAEIASDENAQSEEPSATLPDVDNKIVYINFTPPDPSSEDFWDGVNNAEAGTKKRTGKIMITAAVILLLAAIFGYAILLTHGKGGFANLFGDKNFEFTLPLAETPELEEKYYNDDGTYTAAGVAKAVLPSVVQVQVYTQNVLTPTSQGSGIIITEDGYIVTNAHVVKDAKFGVTVMLYDKTEYSATVVGSDSSTDIAVLKIAAKDLAPAQFADSDKCELGDEVVTIGSPAGFENSLTKGVISGLNRQIHSENSATAMECIQIDAAINPGNSGGPLFNMWGQVIGITSSKLVSSSYDNIGFAITVNSAKPIIEQLMTDGYVPDKPRIGVTYYAITEDAAEINGVVPGIFIVTIDENCNVAKTELAPGDIITEMNGRSVSDNATVAEVMSEVKAGDTMTCKVYRPSQDPGAKTEDGEYFEITFELNSDSEIME